ncbi:MAG TPA: hypothetical protein VNI77_03275 [Nitrososphaera sp.]|nr:hypothetical protein [Nitrososphaera sp.]
MSEFAEEYQTCILTKEGLFTLKEYRDEKELERLVVSNAPKIFGSNSIYFDIKHRIESKAKMRVTDGLLLDLSNKMFWIVEHELSKHDPYKEIEPQINGFIRALSNEETISNVSETIYNELKNDRNWALAKKTFGEDVYYSIRNTLRDRCGILIVIDKVTPQIEELREEFKSKKETKVIEFKTYQKGSEMIYAFKPLALVHGKGKEEGRKGLPDNMQSWTKRLDWVQPQVQKLVTTLINEISCSIPNIIHKARFRWYCFYVKEPTTRRTEFAVILLSKKSATLCVRSSPKFSDPKKLAHSVKGFFFDNERRYTLVTEDDIPYGIDLVKQSYEVVNMQN